MWYSPGLYGILPVHLSARNLGNFDWVLDLQYLLSWQCQYDFCHCCRLPDNKPAKYILRSCCANDCHLHIEEKVTLQLHYHDYNPFNFLQTSHNWCPISLANEDRYGLYYKLKVWSMFHFGHDNSACNISIFKIMLQWNWWNFGIWNPFQRWFMSLQLKWNGVFSANFAHATTAISSLDMCKIMPWLNPHYSQ